AFQMLDHCRGAPVPCHVAFAYFRADFSASAMYLSSTSARFFFYFCFALSTRRQTLLASDDEVLCFKDISPGAEHHYLVVPRDHIKDCTYLQKIVSMANMGLKVLHENNFTDMNDASFGFHLPPYTSVDHLHLHVLAPASQLYICSKYKYTPNHYRFITVIYVVHRLFIMCSF
uniref:HIT domain-containing protein n=1 Tax=Denticeps clupeoides TaxID=299321 RepID=A0AAY4AZP8_9TELE